MTLNVGEGSNEKNLGMSFKLTSNINVSTSSRISSLLKGFPSSVAWRSKSKNAKRRFLPKINTKFSDSPSKNVSFRFENLPTASSLAWKASGLDSNSCRLSSITWSETINQQIIKTSAFANNYPELNSPSSRSLPTLCITRYKLERPSLVILRTLIYKHG